MHRDLKPANIKVRPDGMVKVLDFGLAKAFAPDAGATAADLANSPTLSMQATQAGMILGTAAYMSPEQASGKAVDKRSDLWSFGVVLMEMLTGRPVFAGETISHVLASVLKSDPDWTALPADTPLEIRKLLRRCLEKDRKRRLADASDARLEIEEANAEPDSVATATAAQPGQSGKRRWLVEAGLGVALLALAIPTVLHLRETPPVAAPEMRTEIVTPATTDPVSFALAPDGRQLVFVASVDGTSRLWLRSLAVTTAQPLAGTEGAAYPFWSPDSRSVAFFAGGKLMRLDLGSGRPQTLADAAPQGGTWNADGVIVFARSLQTPLSRVSASGGEVVAVTTLGRQQTSHRFPFFLPDGRHFLFQAVAVGDQDKREIHLGALGSADARRLTAADTADTAGVYVPSGWLLWTHAGALVAQRLDVARGLLSGDPVIVADSVTFEAAPRSAGAFSVSASGLVAYRAGKVSRRQLTWFDRSGKAVGTLGASDETDLLYPRLSPDGRRVAVSRTVQGNPDIWLLDAARSTRFTFDSAFDVNPIWSPDSTRIAFASNRAGTMNMYVGPSSDPGRGELLMESPQIQVATDWSTDGRFLLYQTQDPQTRLDLWVLPLDGDRKPWVFLKTPFNERFGQFSPDWHLVAYMSDESGRFQVYVRPFAGSAAAHGTDERARGEWQVQVSTSGGIYPRWRPDGKELYYLGPEGELMAAPITATGGRVEPGTPVTLFRTRVFGGEYNLQGQQYDVARDGRFLINTVLDETTAPITLLQNWKPPAGK
jgi:Tol biopolymer transport system component